MRPVAEWFGCGMFATTKPNLLIFRYREFNGREFTTFVGAVTKWLVFRLAARAPPIIPRFEFFAVGRFLRDNWFHIFVPY
jgi:hypothetical protein